MGASKNVDIAKHLQLEKNNALLLMYLLWSKKIIIVTFAVVAMAAAVALSFLPPKLYLCSSFFSMSDLNLTTRELFAMSDMGKIAQDGDGAGSDSQKNLLTVLTPVKYSQIEYLMNDLSRFEAFVSSDIKISDKAVEYIKHVLSQSGSLSSLVKPVFALTGEQPRVGIGPRDPKDYVLGVRITNENLTPELAQEVVGALGAFSRDCQIFSIINEYINQAVSALRQNQYRLDNRIIDLQSQMDLLQDKKSKLEKLRDKYPSVIQGERQVVSLDHEGQRFLPPVLQLIGVESNCIDLNEILNNYQRRIKVNSVYLDFFNKIIESKKMKLGREAVADFNNAANSYFSNKSMDGSDNKSVFNGAFAALESINFFLGQAERSNQPIHASDGPVGPNRLKIGIYTFCVSLFAAMFFVVMKEIFKQNSK